MFGLQEVIGLQMDVPNFNEQMDALAVLLLLALNDRQRFIKSPKATKAATQIDMSPVIIRIHLTRLAPSRQGILRLVGENKKTGLKVTGHHYAHGLHSPYWWLKCLVGTKNDTNWAVKLYHRLLVWDIMKGPALTRNLEKVLSPLMGKSLIIYLRKPEAA